MNMLALARLVLRPLRLLLGRFVILPPNSTECLFYKSAVFVAADEVEGDYLEFGVYSGGTFAAAYAAISRAYHSAYTSSRWNTAESLRRRRAIWDSMRFIAFDSFQGLPTPVGYDAFSKDFVEGKFANTEKSFVEYVSRRGVPLSRTLVVPGWFDETLNATTREALGLHKAAIIHVDCDLYESTKKVLAFVEPMLQDGTVIIFDDWFNFRGDPRLGEQRAFGEFLAENPEWIATEYQKEGVWRNSFILNRK